MIEQPRGDGFGVTPSFWAMALRKFKQLYGDRTPDCNIEDIRRHLAAAEYYYATMPMPAEEATRKESNA